MKRLPPLPTPHSLLPFLQQLRVFCLLLLASLLLSGCIQSDVGIQFDHPNRGEIVQHLRIAEQLKGLGGATVQQWITTIEQRSRQLGGRTERLADQSLVVTIPFSSSAELETKFNQFFSSFDNEKSSSTTAELPDLTSQLAVNQNNLLLVQRHRLRYDLDLRSLGVASADGNLLLSPTSLIDLEFRLKTPWGARRVGAVKGADQPQTGRELVWQLTPGELNHLEAVFWLPSPLGIGTLVIVILVTIGNYLKYPRSSQNVVSTPQTVE